MILPSGITISESSFDHLESDRDPYNKNIKIKQKIYNRFAKEVVEITNKSEKALVSEELKASPGMVKHKKEHKKMPSQFK